MSDNSNLKNYPVSIHQSEQNRNNFRLSIHLTREQLVEFLLPHIERFGLHEDLQAECENKSINRKAKQIQQNAFFKKKAIDLGQEIANLHDGFTRAGYSYFEALKLAATECQISNSVARHYLNAFKKSELSNRNTEIIRLHKLGMAIRPIANKLGTDKTTVHRIIKKHLETKRGAK